MTTPSWPGLDGGPALPYRASFQRKSVQLPFATNAVPTELDAPEVVWGTGDPNGAVLGSIGDWYVQQDDGKAVAMWSKSIGSSTTTGWFRLAASHWFDPLFYGAIGDDATNDKAAVQSCFTAAGAVSGMVVLTKMYLCATKVLIPSNVTLVGAGWATGLHFTFTTVTTNDVYLQNSDTTNGNTNITLRGFTVKGAWPNATPGGSPSPGLCSGVHFRRGSNIELTQMQIQNVPGISVSHQGITNFRAIDNYVHDGGRDGITGGTFGTSPSVDVRIECNTILDVHDDFIACNMDVDSGNPGTTPPARWVVMGNVCRGGASLSADNFARGGAIAGGDDITWAFNEIHTTNQACLFVTNGTLNARRSTNIKVYGNTFDGAGTCGTDRGQPRNGLDVRTCDDSRFTDNTSRNAKENALYVADSTELEFRSNKFDGAGQDTDTAAYFVCSFDGGGAAGHNIKHVEFVLNKVRGGQASGARFYYCDDLLIETNKFQNNGRNAGNGATLRSGLQIEADSGSVTIIGNTCGDYQGVPTQQFGLSITSVAGPYAYLRISDNNFEGNVNGRAINFGAAASATVLIINQREEQVLAASGNITLAILSGSVMTVTLNANSTFLNPNAANLHNGIEFETNIVQDGTGGRTLAFGAQWLQAWSNVGNTLGKRSSMRWRVYGEGAGAVIQQIGAQGPYV